MEEGKRAWTNRTMLLFGEELGKTGSKFAGVLRSGSSTFNHDTPRV